MAYTTLPVVYTGSRGWTYNYANLIKANFQAGIPDLFTTKGDIVAATGSKAGARVGVGGDGAMLRALDTEATGVYWDGLGYARGYHTPSGAGSPGGSTWRGPLFGNEVYDIGNHFNTSTGLFTAPHDGYYLCTGMLTAGRYAGTDQLTANTQMFLGIYKNGAHYSTPAAQTWYGAGTTTLYGLAAAGADIIYLTKGQYIGFYWRVSNASYYYSLGNVLGADGCHFSISWLRQ